MKLRSFCLRAVLSFFSVLVFCLSNAYSANWQALGEVPESPKFGRTDYFVDTESLTIDSNIRSVWLKSVFSKPQVYTPGNTYTDFRSFTYYDCSKKTYAVTRIEVYSSEGGLVGSEKQGANYVPVPEGSLDSTIYGFVCSYKK